MGKILIIAISASLVIIITATLLSLKLTKKQVSLPSPTASPVPVSTVPQFSEMPPMEGWDIYESDELGFTMNYPQDFEIGPGDLENSVRFVFLGATQSRGTEVYDGIILHIRAGTYSQSSFQEYVTNLHAQKLDNPGILEVSDIYQVTVAGVNGFEFTETGLGELTNIYLPKSEGEFLHIGFLLADPENMGYMDTLSKMLSTIIIK